MIVSFLYIIVIPILIVYIGAFVDYVIDRRMFPEDWYRTPTKMLNMFLTIILVIGFIMVGGFNLALIFNIK